MTQNYEVQATFLSNLDSLVSDLGSAESAASAFGSEVQKAGLKSVRSINALNEQLDNSREAMERLDPASDAFKEAAREVRRLEREIEKTERTSKQLGRSFADTARSIGRGALAAGAAITAGLTVSIYNAVEATRELNRLSLDAPSLTSGQLANISDAAQTLGIDAGRLADAWEEAGLRVNEYNAGLRDTLATDLAAVGFDINAIAGLTGAEFQQAVTRELAGLDAGQQQVAVDLLSGDAGKTLRVLAQDTEAARVAREQLNATPFFSDEERQRLQGLSADLGQSKLAVDRLQQAAAIGLAPAISGITERLNPAIEGLARFTAENEYAALAVGALGLGLSGFGAFAAFGEQAYFAAKALPLLSTGFVAVAGGIKAATLASLAFIATPVGAIITGIVAVVAGLTLGIKYLSDQFGGFTNLWEIGLAGAKAAFLSFVQVSTLTIRKGLFPVLDALITGINKITGAISLIPGINIPEIDFRFGDLSDQLDKTAADARADFVNTRDQAYQEAREAERAEQEQSEATTAAAIPATSATSASPARIPTAASFSDTQFKQLLAAIREIRSPVTYNVGEVNAVADVREIEQQLAADVRGAR